MRQTRTNGSTEPHDFSHWEWSGKKLQNAANALYAESQGQVSKEAAYQRMIEENKYNDRK